MRTGDIFKLIWANWKARKVQTRLVIGVIALIVGFVALLISLGFGVGDLTVGRLVQKGVLTTLDISSPDPNETPLAQDAIKRFKALKKVKSVYGSMDLAGQVVYNKKSVDVAALAAPRGYFDTEAPIMLSGELSFKSESAKEAVISSAVLKQLGIKSPKDIMGQNITLNLFVPQYDQLGIYRVAVPDIVRKKTALPVKVVGVDNEDNFTTVQIPLGLLAVKNPYYSSVRVNVDAQSNVANVKKQLEDSGFSVLTYGDKFSDARLILLATRWGLVILGLLILIIASIIAANTMTIALLEQAKQVATLRKLGMSRKTIRQLYLMESLSLVGVGSTMGALGAFALGWLLNLILFIIAKVSGHEAAILFALPLYYIPLVIIAGLIVGLIAGVFPSRRAMKLAITEK